MDAHSQRIDIGQIHQWSRDDDYASNGWRKYGIWVVLVLAGWLAIYGGFCLFQKVWKAF